MFTPISLRSSIKSHTTNDEIIFIKAIGNYHLDAMKLDKVTLLNRYIGSLKLRSNWNNMDKHKVLAFATQELSNEMAKKVGSNYVNS
jgi:hypothetical protein